MIEAIDKAKAAGDTMGGGFEVIATGMPIGLGSYVQWDRKLDGRLAQALMSIPAIKGVGIGLGPEAAAREIALYFKDAEICGYEVTLTPWLKAGDEK